MAFSDARRCVRRLHFAPFLLACCLAPAAAYAQEGNGASLPCGAAIQADGSGGLTVFPRNDTFCPLIADPKQIRSFVSFQRGNFGSLRHVDGGGSSLGSVGFADAFGIGGWGGRGPHDGFRLGLDGGVFAQFDLGVASFDLINADYIVGLPLVWRRSGLSSRIRLYHQSSHRGDEYVARVGPEGLTASNLTYEAIESLFSAETGAIRVYGGGEFVLRREPRTFDRTLGHAGAEVRTALGGSAVMFAGIDLRAAGWRISSLAVSARAGIQIVTSDNGLLRRRLLILAEVYDGPSPYGHFFLDEIRYGGIGIHLVH